MFIARNSKMKGDKTLDQATSHHKADGLPVLGAAGFSRFRRVGTLAVFFLALCLLGVDNARAEAEDDVELYSLTFTSGHTSFPDITYFANTETYKFTFEGVKYRIGNVSSVTKSYGKRTRINIDPPFPPDGENRSKFHLHAGTSDSDITKLSFGDSKVSGNVNSWNESVGWEQSNQAVIRITAPKHLNNSLRLAEYPETSDENTGRLEILDATAGDDGQWKWVCDDGFGEEEAKVACGQMDLPTSGAGVWELPSDWLNPQGSGFGVLLEMLVVAALSEIPALLDDVDCKGDESKLINCTHAGRGVSDCELSEAVGVTCQEEEDSDGDE